LNVVRKYDNNVLEEEASKTRTQTHAHMKYMGEKSEQRHQIIVSLNDQNRDQLQKVQEERKQLEEDYENERGDLEMVLLAKKHVLCNCKKEMAAIKESKCLQEEQLQRIAALEQEMHDVRVEHFASIVKMKDDYINEKLQFRMKADAKLQRLVKQANQEANRQLIDYSNNIRTENMVLKRRLNSVVGRNFALVNQQESLLKQRDKLIWRLKYAEGLKNLHKRQVALVARRNPDNNTFNEVVEAKSLALTKLYSDIYL
ncbi:plectin-like, partial [Argonauta hians]